MCLHEKVLTVTSQMPKARDIEIATKDTYVYLILTNILIYAATYSYVRRLS